MRALFFLLVLCLALPSLSCEALDKKTQKRWQFWSVTLARLNPPYVWGDFDCSFTMNRIAELSGVQGTTRTTANRMAKGLDGWKSVIITDAEKPGIQNPWDYKAPEAGDLCFWTNSKNRPYGHVGSHDGNGGICHASSSKGFTRILDNSSYGQKVIRVRRLTFGDKRYK